MRQVLTEKARFGYSRETAHSDTVLDRQLTLHFHISTNSRRENSSSWGETPFVEALSRALNRQGADATLFFRGEEPRLSSGENVVLRIVGPHLDEPVAGLPNLLWIINPLNFLITRLIRRYQGVFCASHILAEQLGQADVNADFLLQATEIEWFHPDKRPPDAKRIPILFVGGYAERARRETVLDAIDAGFEVEVWGPGWDGIIPKKMWHGKHLSYDELAAKYACADIILNAHMNGMAKQGIMNNRTFDGIASGAVVISDKVVGFEDLRLPELVQVTSKDELANALRQTLDAGSPSHETRLARHQKMLEHHSFDASASQLIKAAETVLRSGETASPVFCPRPDGAPVHRCLGAPSGTAPTQHDAMQIAATEILAIASALEVPGSTFAPAEQSPAETELIHPLMADLREMHAIALNPDQHDLPQALTGPVTHARRVDDAFKSEVFSGLLAKASNRDIYLQRIMTNTPVWLNSEGEFDRELQKRHVRLSPRKQSVKLNKPVGVFLHLYYDELAEAFAERLSLIDAPLHLYISTDTVEKSERLRAAFPNADIRIMPNRGRDIYPKFFGFRDVYPNHDIVLHLHGKKSAHFDKLDQWLGHILECLLPSGEEINRLLSYFQNIPSLGMVAPVPFQNVLPAAHWGTNFAIARELAHRLDLQDPLPDDSHLRFPVGSMFWARVKAIQPLVDLGLEPGHFPPEAGQVDGTLSHAIERMAGVVTVASGHRILSVSGENVDLYKKYQYRFRNNGELRVALENGTFDG